MQIYFSALTQIRRIAQVSHGSQRLSEQVAQFIHTYRSNPWIGHLLADAGEEQMASGAPEAALIFFRAAEDFPDTANLTLLYLRLAQIYLEKGQQEEGVAYLIKLCTETVDNYEESIGFNELTDVWNKYKPLVEGLVPPSIPFMNAPRPLSPGECSQSIGEIFALSEDDILSALSRHLNELSGSGEELNCLNKWERNVYYLDELSMEVNSGGFDSYLFHCGIHFEKARKALDSMDAPGMAALLDAVAAKFPRGKVPKSPDAIQNALEKLEETQINFEAEDDAYYCDMEREFLPQLLAYILKNKTHFR